MSMQRTANSLIGAAIERFEDLRFLRGKGVYVGDLTLPGQLHAVVFRSGIGHGRIRSLDVSRAKAMPGVVAIITAADLGPAVPKIPLRMENHPSYKACEQPVLATGKVRYVGEPIALVVADSQALAEDALELINLDIEPLPAVVDRDGALAGTSLLFEETGTNHPATLTGVKGDADAVFASAPYTRRERFFVHRHSAVPMEPRGLLADWNAGAGTMRVYGAAKVPFHNRATLAALIALPESAITMIENDVGGGFGVRGEFYPEDYLVPFAARLLGRPVKWLEDRREHLMATNHARDAENEIEIACTRDGRILALRGKAWCNMGAYIRTTGATPPRNIAQVATGPYRIDHIKVDVNIYLSNKTPSGTYRGPGRFEADFFRERLFDLVAKDLGLDRVAFRRMNLIRESDMPYPLATVMPINLGTETDNGDYSQTLDRCLEEFGWTEKAATAGRMVDGVYRGIALGCYLEGAGSGKEGARLKLESDGTVLVSVGSSAIGQGIETVFRQIAGDALDLPLERIKGVVHGSTDAVKEGVGAFSSRSTVMGGSAVLDAATKLKQLIREAAARTLGCDAAAIELRDAVAIGPGGRSLGFGELAAEVPTVDGSFSSPRRTYSYGAHAVEVAVDAATGAVRVVDYVAVEDVGRIVNPETLHGQCVGAIVQGLGGALLEHFVYDSEGQLLTGSFADYLLPTATDFPTIRVTALEEKPCPNNPLGAKGAGEGGIIPTGGLIGNAVADALSSFGVEPHALPLSPAAVWALIDQARRAKAA